MMPSGQHVTIRRVDSLIIETTMCSSHVIFKSDEICEANMAFKPSVTVSPDGAPIK